MAPTHGRCPYTIKQGVSLALVEFNAGITAVCCNLEAQHPQGCQHPAVVSRDCPVPVAPPHSLRRRPDLLRQHSFAEDQRITCVCVVMHVRNHTTRCTTT